MATHQSAKKADRQSVKRNAINKANKSKFKSAIKAVRADIESKDVRSAQINFVKAQSKISKSVQKSVVKKNKASRLISRLALAIKNISTGSNAND